MLAIFTRINREFRTDFEIYELPDISLHILFPCLREFFGSDLPEHRDYRKLCLGYHIGTSQGNLHNPYLCTGVYAWGFASSTKQALGRWGNCILAQRPDVHGVHSRRESSLMQVLFMPAPECGQAVQAFCERAYNGVPKGKAFTSIGGTSPNQSPGCLAKLSPPDGK